jgi:hypothetical protein
LAKTDKRSKTLRLDAADNRRTAEHPSAQPAAMRPQVTLGADLRAARNRKNVMLEQVARDTRISLRHFKNLEEGHYSEMPGGAYNRAFLRSYCSYLELDPAEFLARYETEMGALSEKAVKVKPRRQISTSQSRRIPQLLIWSVMLLASVTGLYFSRKWIAQVFSPYFSQPPIARLPVSPPVPAPGQPKEVQSPPSPPAVTNAGEQPPVTEPAAAPAAAAAIPDEPPPGTIRLRFEVTDPCWMSLKSDGTSVYSDTLRPGNTPSFDAKEQFEMVLGNAGGVKLKINGKPAKPLGSPGAVIKMLINAANIPDLLEKIIN